MEFSVLLEAFYVFKALSTQCSSNRTEEKPGIGTSHERCLYEYGNLRAWPTLSGYKRPTKTSFRNYDSCCNVKELYEHFRPSWLRFLTWMASISKSAGTRLLPPSNRFTLHFEITVRDLVGLSPTPAPYPLVNFVTNLFQIHYILHRRCNRDGKTQFQSTARLTRP
jgi:hypothetical protein